MTSGALAIALSFFFLGAAPQQQPSSPQDTSAQQQNTQQQAVPDAPAPSGLGDLKDQVTPGSGTGPDSSSAPSAPQETPQSQPPAHTEPDNFQQTPPEMPKPGEPVYTIRRAVNYVDVPVTVRDKRHQLVPGLNWRQFKIYEDGQRQNIAWFQSDPVPLSAAFVIDQSLPNDVMRRVNDSLAAVTGAFGPADSVAVFTYNTSPEMVTDFTGSQGPRLIAALQTAKRPGRDNGIPTVEGPLGPSGPQINGIDVDPNLDPVRGSSGPFVTLPKENHPLNDAILAAAKQLAKQPHERRRIIYVISDGKDAGSKATQAEVIRYLLTNNISVYGTLVGDSAIWGIGYLDKLHLPLLPTNNIMPRYIALTGGALEAQLTENGIQKSFADITSSLRVQYTLGYYSHAPTISEKRHSIEVDVNVPGLDVTAKQYYIPSQASTMER